MMTWNRSPVCKISGKRALSHCPADSVWIPKAALTGPTCAHHQKVFLDYSGSYRVHKNCDQVNGLISSTEFVLAPIPAHFYAQRHPEYTILPPWHPSCEHQPSERPMKMIYPLAQAKIKLPRDLDGQLRPAVFKAAHADMRKKIYWQIDEIFIGVTQDFHSMEIEASPGNHLLTLTDEDGNQLQQQFTRISD